MFKKILLSLLLLFAPFAWAQDRFASGEFKGFTKSPTEGEIVRLDEPVTVRRMTGTVVRSNGDESPIEGVLIELRSPNGSKVIGKAKTGREGKFHVGGIPPGTYVFKATTLGFKSVVGTVVISATARESNVLALHLRPGV
jgi:hypothetical protein